MPVQFCAVDEVYRERVYDVNVALPGTYLSGQ